MPFILAAKVEFDDRQCPIRFRKRQLDTVWKTNGDPVEILKGKFDKERSYPPAHLAYGGSVNGWLWVSVIYLIYYGIKMKRIFKPDNLSVQKVSRGIF